MQSNGQELKEALMYTKYSLFAIIISFLFGLVGYVVKDHSSFTIELLSIGIVGLFIGFLSLLYWYRKWKKLDGKLKIKKETPHNIM